METPEIFLQNLGKQSLFGFYLIKYSLFIVSRLSGGGAPSYPITPAFAPIGHIPTMDRPRLPQPPPHIPRVMYNHTTMMAPQPPPHIPGVNHPAQMLRIDSQIPSVTPKPPYPPHVQP